MEERRSSSYLLSKKKNKNSWKRNLEKFMATPNAIKWQVWIYLASFHAQIQVKKSCKTIYDSFAPKDSFNQAKPSKFVYLDMPSVFKWYTNYSTYYLCVVVLKALLPLGAWIHQLGYFLDTPVDCVVQGRFSLFPKLYKVTGPSVSMLFLTQRFIRFMKNIPYRLNLILFLSLENDYEKKLASIINENIMMDEKKMSQQDLFIRYVSCYPVTYGSKIQYRIRGNRTIEARVLVIEYCVKAWINCCSLFGLLLVTAGPYSFFAGFSDRQFTVRYAGCFPLYEELVRKGEATYWTFNHFPSSYRIYSLVMDALENTIFYWDSGITLTFVVTCCFVFNYDLLLLAKHLHARLLEVDKILKQNWLLEELRRNEFYDKIRGIQSVAHFDQSLEIKTTNTNTSFTLSASTPALKDYSFRKRIISQTDVRTIKRDDTYSYLSTIQPRLSVVSDRNYNNDSYDIINELQSEINDFFEQFEATDAIISEAISLSIGLWFVSFIWALYAYLMNPKDFIFCIVLVVAGTSVASFVSLYLLKLHRLVMRGYPIICSIMAYDKSEYRYKFMKILEFYTNRHQASYSVIYTIPFKTSTFLALLGYTFTFGAISEQAYRNFRL